MDLKTTRTIEATKDRTFKSFFFRWETLLIVLFILVNVVNISVSTNYLNVNNLFTAISTFWLEDLLHSLWPTYF